MNKPPDTSGKPRRNQLCPCGSGIKTKRCCFHPVKLSEIANAEHEKRLAAWRKEIRKEKHLCLIAAAMAIGIPAGRTRH